MPRSTQKNNKSSQTNIKLIGGTWRGRKLHFANVAGLRPTPAKMRETLFNWLQFEIHNKFCLDLFAGSGALGFEAISRGATNTVMVEKNWQAVKKIEQNIILLKTNKIQLFKQNAYQFLQQTSQTFDVIFLDPPFRKNHLPKLLDNIQQQNLLKKNGMIYLEQELESHLNFSHWNLDVIKQSHSGQVKNYLLQFIT